MDELVRWLGEQLDEDERIAREADAAKEDGWWWGPGSESAAERHIAAHDPARVLREVDAKRRVLTEYAKEAWVMEQGHRSGWTEGGQSVREHLIKHWAAIYDQRPGYREEWRP